MEKPGYLAFAGMVECVGCTLGVSVYNRRSRAKVAGWIGWCERVRVSGKPSYTIFSGSMVLSSIVSHRG